MYSPGSTFADSEKNDQNPRYEEENSNLNKASEETPDSADYKIKKRLKKYRKRGLREGNMDQKGISLETSTPHVSSSNEEDTSDTSKATINILCTAGTETTGAAEPRIVAEEEMCIKTPLEIHVKDASQEKSLKTMSEKRCLGIKKAVTKGVNETAKDVPATKMEENSKMKTSDTAPAEEDGKKLCSKVAGIGPGVMRNLGGTGLKGSSLPLLLSMPGSGAGLSLLSAGLPPGRYVILPSTTSSIPSFSSIAPVTSATGVTSGVKTTVITPVSQASKTVTTASSVSITTPTTSTTKSIPSVLIPPSAVERPNIRATLGRGSVFGGRGGVRGRRKSYTAAEKLAMIEAVESGQKKSSVADLFGVAPSTLACILLQKNKIRSDLVKVDLSRRRLRQSRQSVVLAARSASSGDTENGGENPFVHFMSSLSTHRPSLFEDSLEEIVSMPDLSDRMGMEGQPSPSKLDGPSNYLTCSPILPGMPGMHEDTLLGAGPSLSSQEQIDSDNLQVDYEQEIDVKVEPLFNVSPEICEDENSMTNTQSSSDRPSPHSSPTPGMAGPYLLKKETHCTTILDQLLRDDTFTDVTLTAEGQSIKAHKIVLCLASAYFRQVLSKESNVQNVIVFRDIKFSELKNIINFIYTGEATVDASELESFMKTAEMLEVTSLCEGQRNMPKNLPRAREEQSERPNKGSASAKRTQVASHGSPPAKSRKMNDQSTSPRVSKSTAYASTSGASAVSLPCVLPSEIKSEPTTSEDYTLEDDVASRDDDDDGAYGNHDTSPGDYQVPGEPPMMEIEHTPDKITPGKCPFCPQASQQVRKGPTLSKHLLICHNDKTAFCCDVCARVFFKKRSFEVHKEDCVR